MSSDHTQCWSNRHKQKLRSSNGKSDTGLEPDSTHQGLVQKLGQGRKDAITLSLCEETPFEAMTDAVTAIVKLPSEKGDKYIVANWLN